jgi:hypothetical protein
MSKKRTIQLKKSEILKIIAENADKFKKEDLEKFIGGDEDRKIEYPANPGIESPDDASAQETPAEFTDGVDGGDLAARMQAPPSQLLEFLDKLEEAKSVLAKVAAKETDQEVKSKIYSYYEKTQKVAFEMIKEFGVVH